MELHYINRIPNDTRSAIRGEVIRVLHDYATGGRHEEINVRMFFLRVAEDLARLNIIERSPPNKSFLTHDTRGVTESFWNYGVPKDIADYIRQVFWELLLQGILAPSPIIDTVGNTKHDVFLSFESMYLTPHGYQYALSQNNNIRVYDTTGYLSNFTGTSIAADTEMMRYMQECLAVFHDNHLLATIVLLGSASERLIQIVAEQLRDALVTNNEGVNWYTKYRKERDISKKFDLLRGRIALSYGTRIDARDIDNIKMVFEAIRNLRNDIVHSHDYIPTWNEVYGLMHNFVLYFRLAHKIRAYLRDNPI